MDIARRQVHLDFHTSECIEGIGSRFSKEQFQKALRMGHVNSITVFSKCHHGWAYHPSKANERHPHLDFDLLGAQIEAAHEIGVKTPIYLSAGLDEKMALRHPEWLVRNKDQSTTWITDFTVPGYHRFCMNSPYLDYLLAQIDEVLVNYDGDGIFLDIVGVIPCYCHHCINEMKRRGWDPFLEENAMKLAEEVYANYAKRVRETVDNRKPGHPVFHNGGHIRRGRRDLAYMDTHLELESLPTGGWGYDHFPMSAAYARTLGMDFLGMTGKFHLSWGEFGGFKHPNALRYETSLSAASGAKCSVGDQLHPTGEMDLATYALIGKAYSELEQKEPWLDGARNITDVAVLSKEAVDNYYHNSHFSTGQIANISGDADVGCTRILLEGKYLFDMVDTEADFTNYKVLILPDVAVLDDSLGKKVKAFVKNGGKVLATGYSGLNPEKTEFVLDFGGSYQGENPYLPSYFRPAFDIPDIGKSAFVMYSQGQLVEKTTGTELGIVEKPYFNRTAEHFCSHRHSPSSGEKGGCGILEGKDGAYIAWNVFEDYAESGSIVLKEMVKYTLDRLLLGEKSLETNLPAQGVVTLTRQNGRLVNHLLYASPVKRGKNVEIIEDLLPVYNITVSVRTGDQKVSKVYLAPQMEEIPFVQKNGQVEYTVEKLVSHQMVVME